MNNMPLLQHLDRSSLRDLEHRGGAPRHVRGGLQIRRPYGTKEIELHEFQVSDKHWDKVKVTPISPTDNQLLIAGS
jgi:hypothetical protein